MILYLTKATKLRQEEKAKNTETISDSEEAQTAVAQALTARPNPAEPARQPARTRPNSEMDQSYQKHHK